MLLNYSHIAGIIANNGSMGSDAALKVFNVINSNLTERMSILLGVFVAYA